MAELGTAPLILTIGHSTHSLEEFCHLVQVHGVATVVDVRSAPYSRHNPQFNRENLATRLLEAGLGYVHLPGLGGWRRPRRDSPHLELRSPGFRGYADYMETPEFAGHLQTLIVLARQERVAVMCAEALPWRCHRSLIADALVVRGCQVRHILGPEPPRPHRLTPGVRVAGDHLSSEFDAPKLRLNQEG